MGNAVAVADVAEEIIILDVQINSRSLLFLSTIEPIQTGIFFRHIVILKCHLLALK